MSQIVFYDANPTVQALMARMLGQYGLEVVTVPKLEACEEVFKACSDPVAFIADLSRQPEYMSTLQQIVPNFIREPERCILTSVKPPSLAQYLPECLESCFFKHVVERPFKRLDFIQFFENIIKPYLASTNNLVNEHAKSCVNSSVDQITGPFKAPKFDEGLEKQVEGIVESTSHSLPLNQLVEEASDEPVHLEDSASLAVRCGNRMSRRSRAISREPLAAVQKLSSTENSQSRVREQVRNARMSAFSRYEGSKLSSDSHLRQVPTGRVRPAISSLFEDSSQLPLQKNAGSGDDFFVVEEKSASEMPNVVDNNRLGSSDNAYLNQNVSKDPTVPTDAPSAEMLKGFEQLHSDSEEDEESTLLVSPAIVQVSSAKLHTPKPVVVGNVTEEPVATAVFEIPLLKSLLSKSLIRQERYTIVCKLRNDAYVFVIQNGCAEWIERVCDGQIPGVAEFLSAVPGSEKLPIADILKMSDSGLPLSDAFVSQGLEKEAASICRRMVHLNLRYLQTFDGHKAAIYHGVPAGWMPLLMQRPACKVDIIPFLFDELRENADSLIVPQYFYGSCFVMRSWRTPLNVGIELTPEENDILCKMQNPTSIAELRRSGHKWVAETVYRLSLFELIDFVQSF